MSPTLAAAYASCLPGIGPWCGWWNALEVGNELLAHRTGSTLPWQSKGICAALGAFLSKQERASEEPIRSKGVFYSVCGMIGNVLTVATAVALVAFPALKLGIIIGCTSQIFMFSRHLYVYITYAKNTLGAFPEA